MNARLPPPLDSHVATMLLEQSREAIISRDLDGRVLFWNKGAERLFGWAANEVFGRRVDDFLVRDAAPFERAMETLRRDGWWQGDLVKQCADGGARTIECRWSLIRDDQGAPTRVLATDADVTELRKAQRGLQLAGVLFQEAAEGFIVADAEGNILSSNPAFAQLSGFSAQQLEGRAVGGLFLDDHGLCLYPLMRADLRHLGHWCGTAQLRRADDAGLGVWVSVLASLADDGVQQVYTVLDISEKTRLRAEIEHLSLYDPATGLPNRTMCEERIKPTLATARRTNTCVLFCALRVNGLNQLTQVQGMDARDAMLRRLGHAVDAALRQGDTVGRLSEDTFLLVAQLPEREAISSTMGRWRAIARDIVPATGLTAPLVLNMGAALAPDDGETLDDLYRHALIALERSNAESTGWAVYSPRMADEIGRRAALTAALARALEHGGLEMRYQPLVDLNSRALVGAEALLRWTDAEFGAVSPAEFVPLAEANGMGYALDLWVTRAVSRQIAQWHAVGLRLSGRVAINLSASRVTDHDFTAEVIGVLRDANVSPAHIEVEITETTALDDLGKSCSSLERLKGAGFALAVDDFGTGYSSMAYLLRLPLDKVKIDIAFVRDMHRDPKALAIVQATLAMARSIGIRSLAEGIEHDTQRVALADLGCELGQGYHFARPLHADEFAAQWLWRQ